MGRRRRAESTVGLAGMVYQEIDGLHAKLRRYSKEPQQEPEHYLSKTTTIKPQGGNPIPLSTVPVKLTAVSGHPGTYSMTYEGVSPVVDIGYLRFVAGNTGRASSDVIVRLNKTTVDGVTTDPCNEPPIDDMGEEEDIAVGANSSPGPSLPLTAS